MKKYYIPIAAVIALLAMLTFGGPAIAATTADVTVTFTPAYIAIADNASSYDFGVLTASSTTNTSTSYVAITNTSTVQTDMTIEITTANWTGGNDYVHSNTATPGADTVGMNSNNSSWGTNDVIVESSVTGTPNYIYENCPAGVSYSYGISLLAPTSFSDGVQKTATVRISAAAG